MSDRIYYSREAELQARRDRMIWAVVTSGFGIGLGAILALLLAPRSGDETRRHLGEALSQVTSQGREVASQVAKTVREGASKLENEVSERLERVAN